MRMKLLADGPEDDLDRLFDGTWSSFEAWLRQVIGGDFTWNLHGRDSPAFRQFIIDSVCAAMAGNDGVFPEAIDLLRRVKLD